MTFGHLRIRPLAYGQWPSPERAVGAGGTNVSQEDTNNLVGPRGSHETLRSPDYLYSWDYLSSIDYR